MKSPTVIWNGEAGVAPTPKLYVAAETDIAPAALVSVATATATAKRVPTRSLSLSTL